MPSILSRLKGGNRKQKRKSTDIGATLAPAASGAAPNSRASPVLTECHEPNAAPATLQANRSQQAISIETNFNKSTSDAPLLWTQAYLKIQNDDPQLVDEYEALLSKELLLSISISAGEEGQPMSEHSCLQRMKQITDLGLRRMDEKTMKYHIAGNEYIVKTQVAQVSKAILKLKSFIADAVSSSPAASIAVAGVSLILPLLTNPSTMDDANRSGMTYVVSRMQFYIGIEEQLWPKCLTLSGDFRNKLEDDLIHLYRTIMVLQIKSVLRFYRNWAKTTARDIAGWDDWTAMQEDVKAAEAVIVTYFHQLLQLDSRNLLQALNEQAKNNTMSFHAILDGVNDINQNLEMTRRQHDYHHREKIMLVLTKEQQHCHRALKTSAYERHKNINPDRLKGTCRWVLENDRYREWCSSDHNDLLWVSADPGCGKSVLAKSLIDQDLQSPSLSVCYFFFKDNEEQNSLSIALCAVLHQLFSSQPHLLRHALPAWQQNGDKIQQEEEQLWRILMATTVDPAFTNTVCIFDALDECRSKDRGSFIKKLEKFYSQAHASTKQSWLKFFATSRPYDDIQRHFRQTTQSFPHIHIRGEDENALVHDEISLVIKMRVAELAESLQLHSDIHSRLEQQLLKMEHRTYLWLYLAMDDIETQFRNSLEPEEESIELIPSSVSAAYTKILEFVPPDKKQDVELVLHIIVGSRRPLTIDEMAVALGIAKDGHSKTNRRSTLQPQGLAEKLRHLCGLFVYIQDSRIYLIHQTAREFLLHNKGEWFFQQNETNVLLSKICLAFLLQEDQVFKAGEKYTTHKCFLEYAAVYWADHAREISLKTEAQLATQIDRLYEVATESSMLWYIIYWQKWLPHSQKPKTSSHIIMAVINGHQHTIQRYIRLNSQAIHNCDSFGGTALYWASLQSHFTIVQLLLEKGADVNAEGGQLGNSLQAASFLGHIDVMRLLLEKGADVNAKGGYYGNPLQAAFIRHHIDVVQLLFEEGADVNIEGGYYGNPLQAVCFNGNIDAIQLLFEKGADVNANNGYYGSSLQAASVKGYIDIIELLLEKGADVNMKGGYYGTSLQAASVMGHIDIVGLLLEKGADMDAIGGEYGSSLQAASFRGHIDVVRLLLEKGADVNAKGGLYGSSLQAASFQDHIDIVQLLFERGADMDAKV